MVGKVKHLTAHWVLSIVFLFITIAQKGLLDNATLQISHVCSHHSTFAHAAPFALNVFLTLFQLMNS